jgi:hypothetical protein
LNFAVGREEFEEMGVLPHHLYKTTNAEAIPEISRISFFTNSN